MSDLKNLRDILGWSRERLSRAVGLSVGSLVNLEDGKSFNSSTAQRIADGLGISLDNALVLCAGTFPAGDLKALAMRISGGKDEATKGLSDARRNSSVSAEDGTKAARGKASRLTKHSLKT